MSLFDNIQSIIEEAYETTKLSIMQNVEHEQRMKLIRGALYSLKTRKDPTQDLKKIALWIALEDMVGDKEFSFRIALSIPNACRYSASETKTLELFDNENARRLLNKMRTSFYILGARSIQLERDVI